MDEDRRREIARVLTLELDQAHSAYATASLAFDGIVKQVPSGIPHPDGGFRIGIAGKDSRAALERYMRALRRFTDFTVHGTVPGEFLDT